MTIEKRLGQVEQQNQRIQRTNKRLTIALTMTVVVMCAVVTRMATGDLDGQIKAIALAMTLIATCGVVMMVATRDKDGEFDVVVARLIQVTNEAGEIVVVLGASDDGDGLVGTRSAKGTELVGLAKTGNGNGAITTFQPNGKTLVTLAATDYGGAINVSNNDGATILQIDVDDDGYGHVGTYHPEGEEL